MQISLHQLATVLPTVTQTATDALNATAYTHDMSTVRRLAMFLSQCGYESSGFTVTSENLNYSATGLMKTFPRRFPSLAVANSYARQPQSIAARVYALRYGNGDEASGDGWTFRGAGFVQLTFHDNHTACAKALAKPLAGFGDYLRAVEGAAASAGWYWSSRHLNAVADAGDVAAATKIINGGTYGLAARQAHYTALCTVLIAGG